MTAVAFALLGGSASSEPALALVGDLPTLVFTSDVGGQVEACGGCSAANRRGGAASWKPAALAAGAGSAAIWVDAGGFLFGAADPQVVASAYAALDYGAINLAPADFRLGLASTLDTCQQAGLPTVSANLIGPDGQPLTAPFRVVNAGGSPIAIVGVTEAPAALAYLPALQEQLEGITFEDPIAALDRALPEAAAAADHVVLLVHGTPRLLDQVQTRYGSRVAAIGAGGVAPGGAGPAASTAPVIATHPGGSHLAVLASGERAPTIARIPQSPEPDPRVEAALGAALGAVNVATDAAESEGSASSGTPGLILTVHGIERGQAFGSTSARPGYGLLLVDLEIQNNIPLELAFGGDREAGERLKVALKQNLLLLTERAGGSVPAIRESVDLRGAEGALPRTFELQNLGSSARGKVAFELPLPLPVVEAFDPETGTSMALWMEHDELDPASAPLVGPRRSSPTIEVAQANEYLGFSTPAVQFHSEFQGRAAPPGQRWAEVKIAGTSTRRMDGARPKAALYLAAPIHIQLVTDGMWAHLREDGLGTLPDVPGFLPEVASGGTALFLIPEACETVALEFVFPTLQHGGGSGVHLKPRTLVFQVEGVAAAPSPEKALAVVDDDPVRMAVIGVEVKDGSAGRSTVELDLRFLNGGDEDGELDLSGRFLGIDYQFVGAYGKEGEPLTPKPLLPAGAKRALRVRLDVPRSSASADVFEVGYSGITVNPTLRLPLGDVPDGERIVVAEPIEPTAPAEPRNDEVAADPAPEPAVETDRMERLGEAGGNAANAAIELIVDGASLVDSIGRTKKRAGVRYLVIDTRWRLLAPEPPQSPEQGFEGDLTALAPYQIDRLGSLHLVYNGHRLLVERSLSPSSLDRRLRVPSAVDEKTWLAAAKADPESAGPRPREVAGQLVYSVPESGLASASLHLLDEENGNLVIDFLGEEPPPAKALSRAKNDLVGAGIYGVEIVPGSDRSPDSVVSVDVRVESYLRGDPRDFAGRSEPLAQLMELGRGGAIHLLFDGEYPALCTGDELESPLWCLPGAVTGGPLQFKVPKAVLAAARTIDLVIGVRETPVPHGLIARPEPLVLPMARAEGNASASGTPSTSIPGLTETEAAQWSVVDSDLTVSLHDVHAPGDHPHWIEAIVRVRNDRSVPVLWDPKKALELRCERDQAGDVEATSLQTAPADVHAYRSLRLPFKPTDTLWVPAGGARTIELRFKAETRPVALRYRGLLRHVDFPLVAGASPEGSTMPIVDGRAVVDRARPVGGIESVGLRGQDVNQAIDRGRDWMLETLQSRRRDRGLEGYKDADLVMMLALVHTRAHVEFPEFDEQLQEYLDLVRPGFTRSQPTYKNGVLAMLLDAYSHPRYLPLLRDAVTYLVNAQSPTGTWGYSADLPAWLFELGPIAKDSPAEDTEDASGPLRVIGGGTAGPGSGTGATDSAEAHPFWFGGGPVRRQVAWELAASGDNSLTQYAILGLHAAERQGIVVDPDIWRRSLGTTWGRQTATHGWSYVAGAPYGTMTCAGATITGIAMRSLEPRRDPVLDPRLRSGLAWLAKHWAIDKNPDERDGRSDHLYYHYYGLERTGRLLDTEFFGGHEWYATVAKRLVDQQAASGAWPGGGGEVPELTTAFAVLCLTRATETLDPEVLAQERAARAAQLPTTGRLEMRSRQGKDHAVVLVLDASGSMLAPPGTAPRGDRTTKFEHARAALRAVGESLPEEAAVGLVVYGHRKRAREEGADTDVETLIPVGAHRPDAFLKALERLRPRGKTPLALSLDEALKALPSKSRKDSTIVLLTDGGQGREPGDPVQSAERVGRAGVKLEIVAFDLGETQDGVPVNGASKTQVAWNRQIADMAAASGGRVVSVVDPGELSSAVSAAATARPGHYELLNSEGTIVHRGPFGGTLELDPGAYLFRTKFSGAPFEASVEIERGRTTRIEFDASKVP